MTMGGEELRGNWPLAKPHRLLFPGRNIFGAPAKCVVRGAWVRRQECLRY